MKKKPTKKKPIKVPVQDDELEAEYDFSKMKRLPNRFAERFTRPVRMAILDPDVAAVFQTDRQVNAALRALSKETAKPAAGRKTRPSVPASGRVARES